MDTCDDMNDDMTGDNAIEPLPQTAGRAKASAYLHPFGFKRRLVVFTSCFSVSFGAFWASFMSGSDLGQPISGASRSFMVALVCSPLSSASGAVSSHTLSSVLSGLSTAFQSDFICTVSMLFILSVMASCAVALVYSVRRSSDDRRRSMSPVSMMPGWQRQQDLYGRL